MSSAARNKLRTTFRLSGKSLRLTDPALGTEDPRTLKDADFAKLREWAERYRELCQKHVAQAELLALGRDMAEWLDGGDKWLERAFEEAEPPWIVEFAVKKKPDAGEKRFLAAPWELLALGDVHLAAREDTLFCPVRRYGRVGQPAEPSDYRLATVFMAASPTGVNVLSYEAEETAMLGATGRLGLDLVVEESGTLALLGERMAEVAGDVGAVDVLHLSCHGTDTPKPRLILETDVGDPHPVSARDLTQELRGNRPRLLFLSACLTDQASEDTAGAVVDSMASVMLASGVPAVLGWGGSVGDLEATRFAEGLYADLARRGVLEEAVARARWALLQPEEDGRLAGDWHLARLHLGSSGGGVLSRGTTRRLGRDREAIHKTFLDARKLVPVAGPREFVGRRRQIQRVLRELRRTDAERPAGVLIHGLGQQGKSSLAARVASRLSSHRLAVVFGDGDAASAAYEAPAILATVASAVGVEGAAWRERWQAGVEEQAAQLEVALVELLEGACRQTEKESEKHPARQPLLLVVDDLEQVLEEEKEPCLVQREAILSLRAVIRAFRRADTQSRLLFTSRYRFSLPHGDEDLAKSLHELQLLSMQGYESLKQARNKLPDSKSTELTQRIETIVEVAGGHAGLQALLFTLAAEDSEACERALAEMKAHREGGGAPERQELVDFLEKLALEKLVGVLGDNERELLRASRLFEMPVPRAVIQALASALALAAPQRAGARLVDLGLWEVHVDSSDSEDVFLARLARPYAGALSEEETATLAGLCVDLLFEAWGGADGRSRRSYAVDYELTRLALLSGKTAVVAAAAADAVLGVERRFLYKEAASLGRRAIEMLDAVSVPVPPALLRLAGRVMIRIGETLEARSLLQRVVDEWRDEEHGDLSKAPEYGAVLYELAGLVWQEGDAELALEMLERALELFKVADLPRERAVTMGKIADIYFSRGDLDEALRIRQEEQLPVFKKLGDVRERVVTMGKIADIYFSRGDLDEALRIRQAEELPVYEKLGDVRERAVATGKIADIYQGRGDYEKALQAYLELVSLFDRLGDIALKARALSAIADIYFSRGDLDEALRIRQEESLPVYEKLGDVRSRALTMGKIADIYYRRGDLDEALRIRQEEELPVYEQLGDVHSRAMAMGKIADIYFSRGDLEEARRIRQEEELPVYDKLGDLVEKGRVIWRLAQADLGLGDAESAFERFVEADGLFMQVGHLEGVCWVGIDLGQLLAAAGQIDEARVLLERSRDGFTKLGRTDLAQQPQQLLDSLPPPSDADNSTDD